MDSLDRMYRHLVRTIRSRFPQYLTQPFEVGELAQTILPYRHHRRELGLETNEDYEMTLTELLSGVRDYLVVDDRMRDVLSAELASVNPDPSAFKQFAHTALSLAPGALLSLGAGPADELSPPRASSPVRVSSGASMQAPQAPQASQTPGAPETPEPLPARDVRSPATSGTAGTSGSARISPPGFPSPGFGTITPQVGDRCPACDEGLPAGRAITFCPHCGQNVTTSNCPACGSELEVGWKFCPSCGRPAASH